MAKIRGIKPDTWTDEKFVDLTAYARLLFIGMWNYACDNGHLEDKSRQLKMRILPADDVNVSSLVAELEAVGCIERADGWITLPNLTEHQRVDRRYFTTCDKEGCVDPPEKVAQRESRRVPTVQPTSARRAHAGARVDGDGDGDGDVDGDCDGELKVTRKRATQLPPTWEPTQAHITKAQQRNLDLTHEVDQFRSYHEARATTFVNWDKAFHNWLGKAFPRRAQQLAGKADRAREAGVPEAWL